ncbi:MAG: hypothetical protein EHJ95_01195 [Methanobacteriota archaeon]|nr:MAG: hypothetical protein EHJ95_01195 [Euryarchaeota archaeon]
MGDVPAVEEFDLGVPQKGAKEGYLQTFFNNRMQIAHTIMQMQGVTDFRIEVMTMFIISGITDEAKRNEIVAELEKDLDAIKNGPGDMDEKGRRILMRCMKAMGDVSSWFDAFMGITHRLSVGIGGVPFWKLPGGEDYEPDQDPTKCEQSG